MRGICRPILLFGRMMLVVVFSVACSSDCQFAGTAVAWIDENENGMWDRSEPPLHGVSFFVDDVENQIRNVGDPAISNENGEALVYVWLPGCPRVKLEVYATPPPAYRLTTQPRINAREDDRGPFLFGFISIADSTELNEDSPPLPGQQATWRLCT
jgi:hypothetical protein